VAPQGLEFRERQRLSPVGETAGGSAGGRIRGGGQQAGREQERGVPYTIPTCGVALQFLRTVQHREVSVIFLDE
jgi:hypothetical protein